MNKTPRLLDELWNDLLSRKPDLIRSAYDSLDPSSRKSILDHLRHMVDDAGWQPEQRKSARAGLQALENYTPQDE